ncbi:zinc finger protein 492-like isoform X1 [Schistocerca piceifrons]|uniref:zinc finger protein 492-like isoform X1 n=3 Tax=Schistocerca piceifrons TaxID=274613 RepID=UPI001F5ED3ED|nr:zinc finger protein 492-like isoform X1 [Schistocerca piceifrons]
MNVKEELEESVNKEFLEDPLKAGDPSVCIKQDPELKHHAAGSEHNSVEDPLGISLSTDFIKEDPELNITENTVETSIRCASDSARFTQTTGGRCSISCEDHRLDQDELVIDMEKSTHGFSTNTEDLTIGKECSVATQYDCSTREKELHVYSCNFCQQSFSSKYRLIMHVFTHIGGTQPPSYVCKWCGEVFHSNVGLKMHVRMSENCRVLTADSHEKYGHSDEHQTTTSLDSKAEVSVTEHNDQSSCKETWKDSKKPSNDVCNTHMTNDREKTSYYGTLSIAVNVSAQADLLTANRTHRCGICGKLFARSGDFNRHVSIHTGKRHHKCDICEKWFAQSRYLKAHTLIHTRKKPYMCEICGKSFTKLGNLKQHSLIHTGNKPHKCDHQTTTSLDSEAEVSVTEHNDQSSCKETWKDSKNPSNDICNTHMTNDREKTSYYGTLSIAVNVSAQADLLTANRTHRCGICGKLFARYGDFNRHVSIHTGKRLHKCDICEKWFAQSRYLKAHTLIHTRKKPYMCEICGKSFTKLGNLKQHSLIHTGNKPHKCEICGKSFTKLDNLKQHSLIHTGKKPYKCEICGKSFTRLGDLNQHALIHTGKKPHKCEICGKSFAASGSLKKHSLIHAGKKPHKCEIRGESFATSGDLKTQAFQHTGSGPHKCGICDKSFTYLNTLKTHALLHVRKKM